MGDEDRSPVALGDMDIDRPGNRSRRRFPAILHGYTQLEIGRGQRQPVEVIDQRIIDDLYLTIYNPKSGVFWIDANIPARDRVGQRIANIRVVCQIEHPAYNAIFVHVVIRKQDRRVVGVGVDDG